MIPLLAIPVLNRGDLLWRFVESLDFPVENLLIINNGTDPSVDEAILKIRDRNWKAFREGQTDVYIWPQAVNLGVSGSFNLALSTMMAGRKVIPYTMLAGSDMLCTPGDLEMMHNATVAPENADKYQFLGNEGYNVMTIKPACIDEVGFFDENFFPAYCEDCDYHYRLFNLGNKRVLVHGTKFVHGTTGMKGSCTIHSNPKFLEANSRTHANNGEYYQRKWGGMMGHEVFKTPFNNPNLTLRDWTLEPGRLELNAWPK